MGMAVMTLPEAGGRHSRAIALTLAAGTTAVALLGFSSLRGLLDSSDDLEDEAQSDALEVAVVFCRVWMLSSAVVGIIAVRAVLQSHLPSLRIFALHAIVDSILAALLVFIFALTVLSSSVSQNIGHAVCEHLSRGDAWGLVSSPGSGMELCEERWNYGLAPLLLLIAGIALFIRTKTAIFIYDYYRRIAIEGKISLESPSVTSLHSSRSSSEGVHLSSYDEHRRHHQHHQHRTSPPSPTRPRNNTTSSAHSRSSSSSTVRPFRSATASRIMLLPPDYQNQQGSSPSSFSPSLHITPPSPHLTHSNSSCDSIDTVKGVSSCSSNPSFSNTSRKRAMSHDSGSDPYNHVVVYAPVLMSIEEAQQLGGKEAVIASASASASGMCSSPTNYASASPRLRNVSPPGHPSHPHQHHRHQQHHPSPYPRDTKSEPKRSDSEGSSTTIMPDNKTPVVPPMSGNGTSPFAAIKGYRDTTEMDDLASATKNA